MTATDVKGYPSLYRKCFQVDSDEPFHSRHLLSQSRESNNETATRSSALSTKYGDRFSHLKTFANVLQTGHRISKYHFCLGSRSSVDQQFDWLTYEEVKAYVDSFSSALFQTMNAFGQMEKFIGIYGRNSVAWFVAQHSSAVCGIPFVPIYATLGKEALQHILNQTNLQVLACNTPKEALYVLDNFESSIKCVIVGKEDEDFKTLKNNYGERVQVYSLSQFVEYGQKHPVDIPPPTPEMLCTICYTSGSTGIPKGVMLEHQQMIDCIKSALDIIEGKFFSHKSVHLSYLPNAHILEQIFSALVTTLGGRMGFLTGGVETLMDDFRALKPTHLAVVPRVLSRIHSQVMLKASKWKTLKIRMMKCVDVKLSRQAKGKYEYKSLIDRMIFKKVRKSLGGNVCVVVCGGAALNPEINRFFRAALNCPLIEGYGATETTGMVSATLTGETETGIAGALATRMELKLIDVPDMDLKAIRDNTGEICVRGLRCTRGYYKDDENTKKLIDEEGWLRTGDIGKWSDNGKLKIVDRSKNIFKLSQGEYVAAEKVEGVYQCCTFASQAVVDGISMYSFAVCILVPDFVELRKQVSAANLDCKIDGLTNEQLCQNGAVRKFTLKQLQNTGAEQGLKGFEQAKNICLWPDPMSVENGLLTPTFKLSRFRVRKAFKHLLEDMYEEGELKF